MRNPWGHGVEWRGDWADDSNLWTNELKKQLGWTSEQDGTFFMTFDDYLSHYSQTTVNFSSISDYHSYKLVDMNQKKTVYLSFTLSKKIDFSTKLFSISVSQQGDRLRNYRPHNNPNKFSVSPFSIVLLKQEGEVIDSAFDKSCVFQFSLDVQKNIMDPGTYVAVIDTVWDQSSNLSEEYKKVLVDIYCEENV